MKVRRASAVGTIRLYFPDEIADRIRSTIEVVEDGADGICTTEMKQYRSGLLVALKAFASSFALSVSPDGRHVWSQSSSLRWYSPEQIGAAIDAAYRARREVGTASSSIYRLGFETALETLATAFELEEDSGPTGIFQRLLG